MRSSLVVSECDNAPLQRLKATQLFKTLSDPTRLQILYILAQNQGTNICAIELSDALKVSPPTVTHHMKKPANGPTTSSCPTPFDESIDSLIRSKAQP